MDGEWEVPHIPNPACQIGCGEWKPPMIDNPKYKGIWRPPMINNPNYQVISAAQFCSKVGLVLLILTSVLQLLEVSHVIL